MLEADNVVLVQTSVNLDLRHELLLGTSLGQGRLKDDLGRRYSLVLQISELEAASESSLTKELTLEISLNANFSIIFDYSFFNDGLGSIDSRLFGLLFDS